MRLEAEPFLFEGNHESQSQVPTDLAYNPENYA